MTLLVAGVTWEWSRPEGQWVRSGVEQFSKTAIGAAREVVRTARYEIGVAKWELGLSKQAPDTLPAPTTSKPAAGREAGPDGTVSAGPLPQPQPIAGVSAPQPPPADPSRAAEIAPSQPVGRDPGAGAQAGQLAATATAVYTAADPQVVPPVLIRPSRPVKPPAGVGAIDVAEVEIVISITGEVESVRLLSPWNGPQPAMLLSAIKAWAFQPATRGGQAVRYRQRLQVSTR